MTGLQAKTDAIIEIGAIRVREGQIQEEFQCFVNPSRQLSEIVMNLTGITQQMADSGISQEEAFSRITEFLGDDILVGHNIIFDYSFLKQQAVNQRVTFEKKAVDTLKLSRKFLTVPEKKSLDCLCEYYGFGRESAHRALDDTKATMELYQMLEKYFLSGNPTDFEPKILLYKPKRQTPATYVQKKNLKELLDYHRIESEYSFETITRSEASRAIDRILAQYGKMPK
jgi:DNA polymerase-3 subunit alpha (Gram-positive type)